LLSKDDLSIPMDAGELIPHEFPVCQIDRVIACEPKAGTAETEILPDNIFIEEGNTVNPLATLEMIAQSFAAVKSYNDLLSGKPIKRGFLVGSRSITFKERITTGDRLTIRVETVGDFSGFGVVAGKVFRGDILVAEGTIKVWMSETD